MSKISFDTLAPVKIIETLEQGFKEIICEIHKTSSGPLPSFLVKAIARESSTRWCLECKKLTKCLRVTCKGKVSLENLWLCSSCGIHKCEHLCYVKAHHTATCNACRFEADNLLTKATEIEMEETEDDKILLEIKKLQPTLAPDREREWPWIIKRLGSPPTTILDAACGGGFLQKYLLNLNHYVTATDFNPDARFYSADGPEREEFILQDLREFRPDWRNMFDHVLLISTVEHLEGNDDITVVRNLSSYFKQSMFLSFPYGVKTEWKKIGNNTERFYSDNGLYERLILPAKLRVKNKEVFTKEELDWPWKDIMLVEVVKAV